ncbi:MAG: hypothetical protein PHH24_04145 [Candidatus Moranbacteria bacterium]|jgi:hypothetical protein|nr:hypothetical protein [Candidatus Moranbacteria bacterium]MDD5651913.1 hypothetical protein [Candidatus Moranbacteria bacterium]MDX9855204.1 hypothetical protein [Candidatus Moranbacteria bacterium]
MPEEYDHKTKMRKVDIEMEGLYSWLGSYFAIVQKKKVKTWQGVMILSFVAGAAAAIIWSVSLSS